MLRRRPIQIVADLAPTHPAFGYIVRITPDGTLIPEWRSESIIEILGVGQGAGDFHGWQDRIHPDDQSIARESIESLARGEPWSGELRLLTMTGETRWMHFYSEPEVLPDGSVRIEGWGHDVTATKVLLSELQQMEERLRLLEDHVLAVTWTTDRDLRFTMAAGSGLSLLGLEPDQVVGMTFEDYFGTSETGFPAIAASRRALEGEVVWYEQDWVGSKFRCVTEPLNDLAGNLMGTLGVAVAVGQEAHSADRLRNLNMEIHEMRMSASGAPPTAEVMEVGDLKINPAAFVAWQGSRRLKLSPTEFRLLVVLMNNRSRVLSREYLLKEVWHHDFMGESRLVDMAINRLRHKIENEPTSPELIRTVRGIGYRFEDKSAKES